MIWNSKAPNAAADIILFLREHERDVAVANFKSALCNPIQKLVVNPLMGRPAKKFKTIRYKRFNEHCRLYYRVVGHKMYLVNIVDTRTDPAKHRYE